MGNAVKSFGQISNKCTEDFFYYQQPFSIFLPLTEDSADHCTLFWNHINKFKVLSYFSSSHPEEFLIKGVLKICSKFTGEHPCRSAISISNFIEIALRHGCSPVNLLHIFRTCFPRNTSVWLLLIFAWTLIVHRFLKYSMICSQAYD